VFPDEQVAAAGEGEAGLAGLHAQDVGVEEGEVGPFVEGGEADFFQHLPLDEDAEAAEANPAKSRFLTIAR
jgi:hypothetical protein